MAYSMSVLFLHDQLQDARIWSGIRPLVSVYANVQTVSPPPLHSLGLPSAWADHIGRHARESNNPRAVDLVATIGGAGKAGIELVADGAARLALLIDPDATPLAEGTAPRIFAEPAAAGKLAGFLEAIDQHVEELVTSGTLSEAGIESFVEATFAGDEEAPQQQRELLRRMMTEQLRATLPLDLATLRSAAPERPDWVTRLAPVADQCTIAITGGQQFYSHFDVDGVLHRRAPGVTVVWLASPSTAALSDAAELSGLIRDLLAR